jgi:hypothetical protein
MSFSLSLAKVVDFLSESIPSLYQSQVLGDACSKVDFAQGSTRSIQKLLSVGTIFLSRIQLRLLRATYDAPTPCHAPCAGLSGVWILECFP